MAKEVVVSGKMRAATDRLMAVIGGSDPLLPIMQVATRIVAVTEWFKEPEIMAYIKALQNNENGFLTDGQYDEKVLANVATTALVNDFKLVGNEFNIIAGRFYGAKNGYKRKCQEFEDNAYKMLFMADPENLDVSETPGMVTVPINIRYVLCDKSTGLEVQRLFRKRIQIAKKSRDSIDTWLGKAHKRAYQRLLSELTGLSFLFDDNAGDGTVTDANPTVGKTSTKPTAPAEQPLPQGAAEGSFSEVPNGTTKDPAAAPFSEPQAQEPPEGWDNIDTREDDAAKAAATHASGNRNQVNPTTEPTPAATGSAKRPHAKGDRF